MGVDLNSFIGIRHLSQKKTLAKLSPSCVLSFAEVCCIYVYHGYQTYDRQIVQTPNPFLFAKPFLCIE